MDEPLPDVRAGDRERREVDDRLRRALADGRLTLSEYEERSAQCWAARTLGELDVLTADLPDTAPEPVPLTKPTTVTPAAPSAPAPPHPQGGGPGVVQRIVGGVIGVALAGGALFLGAGIVRAPDGASVFSSGVVRLGADQDLVQVGVLFGSMEIVVPDDVSVRPAGRLVFGSMDCEQACTGTQREVVVDAVGAFGSVEIVRESERDRDDD